MNSKPRSLNQQKGRALSTANAARRFFAAAIPSSLLLLTLFFPAIHAAGQPPRATQPRSRQVLDLTRINESWAREWEVTQTAVAFPGGGRAGFYRRPARMEDAVPHMDRLGILYLYPESIHIPARIVRRNIRITRSASRLAVGVCANRRPRGEWILKVLVDGKQTGDDLMVSGKDGWRDIAYDLSAYLDRRVDIEIEAHATTARAAHVYFDYIRLTDPTRQPVTELGEPATEDASVSFGPLRGPSAERPDDSLFFDIYYYQFLELLKDREERRRYNTLMNRNCPRHTGCR